MNLFLAFLLFSCCFFFSSPLFAVLFDWRYLSSQTSKSEEMAGERGGGGGGGGAASRASTSTKYPLRIPRGEHRECPY